MATAPNPPALTAQERQALHILIAAGVRPRDALAALLAARAAGQALPTDAELDAAAMLPPDPTWWRDNPAVPPELRRILDAVVGQAP